MEEEGISYPYSFISLRSFGSVGHLASQAWNKYHKMALRVEFEDGESSEILIYSGETIETPCEPVGGKQLT